MLKDRDIVDLYYTRDERAITQTDYKYGRYCEAIAFRFLQNEEDTEECLNETYLRAWNMIPPCCPANFRTFLGRVVRRVALDMLDQRTAQRRGGGETALLVDELESVVSSTRTVEMTVDELALQDTIDHFLEKLPKKERYIFVHRYWYMEPTTDIAEKLGQSDSSIRMSLSRTRKKLKTALEKEGIVF